MTSLREARRTSLDVFCVAHPEHFERPHRAASTQAGVLSAGLPDSWRRATDDDWSYCSPPEGSLPEQGWKIHVSSLPGDASDTLEVCAAVCVSRGVPFKHLRSSGLVAAHNGKYAARASSGKFVTIYPPDEERLLALLEELDETIGGRPAPYILSDLRWRRGPVHVRYGGFRHLECSGSDGQAVAAVRRPDGVLVPDLRVPWLEVPSWAPVPEPLSRMRAATMVTPPTDYVFEEALHFSNGGGVYAGRRAIDGRRVVLKEGRPWAGLDAAGGDGASRLKAEETAMRALVGLPGVPEVLDSFELWEHRFVVTANHGSLTFQRWLAANHPGIRNGATEQDFVAYATRALAIVLAVSRSIAAIHARGWTFGDLHPGNILIDDDEAVTLIDYELATPRDAPRQAGLACPGFVRAGRSASDEVTQADDLYAVAALALWCLAPMSQMLAFEPALASDYAAWARSRWNVPMWWDAIVDEQLIRGCVVPS
ncbi:MAG: phosphotransferase, partial [Terracoccus sp.]